MFCNQQSEDKSAIRLGRDRFARSLTAKLSHEVIFLQRGSLAKQFEQRIFQMLDSWQLLLQLGPGSNWLSLPSTRVEKHSTRAWLQACSAGS